LIDLHAHTDQSDGSDSPEALIDAACALNLEALAITDHDTLAGYDIAAPLARARGLDLVCGVEISTRLEARFSPSGARRPSAHLLAYFATGEAPPSFRQWLEQWQHARRERNARLVDKLNSLGIEIQLAEAEEVGRNLTGRPHFAQVLVRKGYASGIQDAFDRYLADGAQASVAREEPGLFEAIEVVRQHGGIASLAHPMRLPMAANPTALESLLLEAKRYGLQAIEVHYSDHAQPAIAMLDGLAARLGLLPTGGSDYHGANKPGIALGVGRGGLCTPRTILDGLRAVAAV
jgi:predicted metal-dependent phosphoesterase TrpH